MAFRAFLGRNALAILLCVVGALSVAGILAYTVGVLPTLAMLGSLLIAGTVPGALLTGRLFGRTSVLHYVIIGTVLGLALLSLGGVFSHVTGLFWIRWLPSIAAVVVAFAARRRAPAIISADPFPRMGLLGIALGTIGLLPALRTVLSTEPVQWSGWFSFYADMPFHVALASEVAARAPEVYPWVPGTPLSYPWLYHSAMGVWASITGIAPADVVLQAWPALFVFLLPAVIAICAWEITKNKVLTVVTPLLYVFTSGVLPGHAVFSQQPLYQISPTRDFADLMILVVVMCLVKTLASATRPISWWWLSVLAISTFVASGAKGSSMPILLGGALSGVLALILARRIRWRHALALTVFGASAALSYFVTLPDAGSAQGLSFGPLTFLGPDTPQRTLVSAVIVLFLLIAIIASWLVVARGEGGDWVISSTLAGVSVAGVLGLSLFKHTGYSQNYFWENAVPIFTISVGWAALVLARRHGWRFAVVVAGVFVSANVLGALTLRTPFLVIGCLVLALAGGALLVILTLRGSPRTFRAVVGATGSILLCAGVLTQANQVLAIPTAPLGGTESTSSDLTAISADQLAAFNYIKTHTQPNDELITNKHCLNEESNDCDARWFALAAWTQRHVLVEGWAYTQNGFKVDFVKKQLELSNQFVNNPSSAGLAALQRRGVRLVYIDKREAYSPDLGSFSTLIYNSGSAAVYRLTR